MKKIKKIIYFIFNPIALFHVNYKSDDVSSFFTSHEFMAIVISVLITIAIFILYVFNLV